MTIIFNWIQENMQGGGYKTRKVVTYNTLGSIFFSKNFWFYFQNSPKGQFAEVVDYNTLGSKIW